MEATISLAHRQSIRDLHKAKCCKHAIRPLSFRNITWVWLGGEGGGGGGGQTTIMATRHLVKPSTVELALKTTCI